ncbi:MAG: hypothetical protein EAY75_01650 [Bacteroidetes bacterium]|nr:MAG: hypothetical protein EAY75_01650 [Bacteroidota bacterium]
MQPVYRWFYGRLPLRTVSTDGNIVILDQAEAQRLRRLERWAILVSGVIGALGVLVLFLPKYSHAHWFYTVQWAVLGHTLVVPVGFTVYSFVLVFLELELLNLLHIYCMHQMAAATGFLHYENQQAAPLRRTLLDAGLEKKNKDIVRYGINPLEGLNQQARLVWLLLLRLKASVSNMVFKFLVQRMLGRYAFQWVQDMAGIPVFAAWNAWGTFEVLRQGRIIIMGQNLIEVVCQRLFAGVPTLAAAEGALVFDTLQYVAISKRDFHANHASLAQNMVEHYGLQKTTPRFSVAAYRQALVGANPQVRQLCQLLIILGFLLDGKLSLREQKGITLLNGMGLLRETPMQVKWHLRQLMAGKGVQPLLSTYLDALAPGSLKTNLA